ncbi:MULTISPECIES: hypothetical protein [Actinosynnema]|uniref:hypothetical protein n=1 Tax=Actinosynnema TaxID=40566 RepID=UPI0020A3B0C7|nr:hypothetical protein [Actinosynnema pretiosum]MCP2093597.1 hypothetical protein [Actinosynnema pretiosum]
MDQGYAVFLLLGVVLVLIDGQLIYRSGRGYMNRAYGDPEAAASMTRLATVLFHLVMFGLLALVSLITPDTGNQVQNVVVQLGIMLLVLAAVHAATMVILARIRDRQIQQQLADEMARESRRFEQENGPVGLRKRIVERTTPGPEAAPVAQEPLAPPADLPPTTPAQGVAQQPLVAEPETPRGSTPPSGVPQPGVPQAGVPQAPAPRAGEQPVAQPSVVEQSQVAAQRAENKADPFTVHTKR